VYPFRSSSAILCREGLPMLGPRAATYACYDDVVLSALYHCLSRIDSFITCVASWLFRSSNTAFVLKFQEMF
jgi:hypothetical protein